MIVKQISSLEKIFLKDPMPEREYTCASVLCGEVFDYQIVYSAMDIMDLKVSAESELDVTLYAVEHLPSALPVKPGADDDYITKEPGLFPDLLKPVKEARMRTTPYSNTLWVSVKTKKPGVYPITVTFDAANHEAEATSSVTFTLTVLKAKLPEQKMTVTQWFHGDCIASYYNEPVFSESHWSHLEEFIKTAAEHGINMLLTPVFTPPLDTQVGGERLTIQLVDVFLDQGQYRFEFEKLRRWIGICKKYHIRYLEISHLFTQWGAEFTPKIMATVDGVEKRIFGWDVKALSEEYQGFLTAFLPALTKVLKEEKMDAYFHVSDEPGLAHLEQYRKVKELVSPYLKDYKMIDALSNYDFYQTGVVEHPVPSSNHIEPFLGVKPLWTYYCTSQGAKVSNRFFAMPSYRNRVIGLQFYKYSVEGFLHWGYNFYYSQFSRYPINPFEVTDAGQGFQSGDAFSVYPGDDGTCWPSLRIKVFYHALQDVRALELLESFVGREKVLELIESEGEITFSEYPRSAEFILSLREKVNAMIEENISE